MFIDHLKHIARYRPNGLNFRIVGKKVDRLHKILNSMIEAWGDEFDIEMRAAIVFYNKNTSRGLISRFSRVEQIDMIIIKIDWLREYYHYMNKRS